MALFYRKYDWLIRPRVRNGQELVVLVKFKG